MQRALLAIVVTLPAAHLEHGMTMHLLHVQLI
jgi:hypothetical protein